ncbi:hypothetical protein K0M31_017439 [Melipona bicolor]|uniref:Uncharacterized protein n=1 Tax=Melipona bicolor TaxID=60889 RepID=A0AA40G4W0_9HYME|nr:hypothetical protein K0M31_017439 [Melipona bicolor]
MLRVEARTGEKREKEKKSVERCAYRGIGEIGAREVSKGVAASGREGRDRRADLNGRERKIVERYGSACALGYTEFLRTFPSVGSSTPDREQPVIGGPRDFRAKR